MPGPAMKRPTTGSLKALLGLTPPPAPPGDRLTAPSTWDRVTGAAGDVWDAIKQQPPIQLAGAVGSKLWEGFSDPNSQVTSMMSPMEVPGALLTTYVARAAAPELAERLAYKVGGEVASPADYPGVMQSIRSLINRNPRVMSHFAEISDRLPAQEAGGAFASGQVWLEPELKEALLKDPAGTAARLKQEGKPFLNMYLNPDTHYEGPLALEGDAGWDAVTSLLAGSGPKTITPFHEAEHGAQMLADLQNVFPTYKAARQFTGYEANPSELLARAGGLRRANRATDDPLNQFVSREVQRLHQKDFQQLVQLAGTATENPGPLDLVRQAWARAKQLTQQGWGK